MLACTQIRTKAHNYTPAIQRSPGPRWRAIRVKYLLYTHIIAFIVKSNWKSSLSPHKWAPQCVHFRSGIYGPETAVPASSSPSISSKLHMASELFNPHSNVSTSALKTTLSSIMRGSKRIPLKLWAKILQATSSRKTSRYLWNAGKGSPESS